MPKSDLQANVAGKNLEQTAYKRGRKTGNMGFEYPEKYHN